MAGSIPQAASPAFSNADFRAALATFATGVTIVTSRDPSGLPVGITANSFASVSLAPPLVLWSLARGAGSMPAFEQGSHYAINILASDQHRLAERFATKAIDRFVFVKAGRLGFFDSFDAALQAEPVRAYLGRLAPPPAQSGSSVK